jgi:Mrp family chromosome partitioning ATPase
MMGDVGLDLPRFLALLRVRWRLIAATVLGAFMLAVVLSLAQSDRYTASADLLFGRTTNADAIVAGTATDTGEIPERAAATNLALASLDTVARRVARRFEGASANELKEAVSIEPAGESDVVTVTAEWGSATQAAAVANAFAAEIAGFRRGAARAEIQRAIDALRATMPSAPEATGAEPSEAVRAVQARLSQLEALKALQTGNVQVVEEASPPGSRSSPTPLRTGLIAALVALALAVALVVLLARFDDRISDEQELTALMGVSVLARIPRIRQPQMLRRNWNGHDEPAFGEAFEFLRLNLELLGHDGQSCVVAVTSPAADDGKTTVVAGLARSLAASGAEVIAVDLDLRKPDLHSYFDTSDALGSGVLDALLESGYAENGSGDAPAGWEHTQADPEADVIATREHAEADAETELAATRGRRAHSEEDIAIGLIELARCKGQTRKAARALKSSGRSIPESTLRRWKEVHADLYDSIRAHRTTGVPAGPHLRLLRADNHPQMPTGTIARGRLQHLFDGLRQSADWIVVDTVPVSTVADASAVAASADGVILVVDLDQTRRRDLLDAKKQLANARAKVFGLVVNRADVAVPIYHINDEDRQAERTLSP